MSEKDDIKSVVYDKRVIDFVTVAVEICMFLEKENVVTRDMWVDKMLKLLPLLYVKAQLLPEPFVIDEDFSATFVREEDYERVLNRVAEVTGDEDVYLDVFMDEMKYSDTPVSAFISENVADIYQDIRNFVSVYQLGLTDQMNDALYQCRENFFMYWGQKLVNVLRPLHALMCRDIEKNTPVRDLSEEESWD